MNGWQRLWVLACVLWGITIAVVIPSNKQITTNLAIQHEHAIIHLRQEFEESKNTPVEGSYAKFLSDTGRTASNIKADIQKENEKYARKLEELQGERTNMWVKVAIGWAASSVFVYFLGFFVYRIYRGFRPKTA